MKFVTIFDPKKDINFVGMFGITNIIGIALPLIAFLGLFIFGMPWGIDFLGGAELQVKFAKDVPTGQIRDTLNKIGFDKNQVQQFGASDNHEMLIRVERMAALNAEELAKIKTLVAGNFSANNGGLSQDQRVLFDEKSGNQLGIWLDVPFNAAIDEPHVQKELANAQKAKLLDLLVKQSGVELRKTTASSDEAPDYTNAITGSDAQNGVVHYTVHFAGVAGKIKKALEENFGDAEIRRVDFVDSQVSRQLRTDGVLAILYALFAIVIYIAIRFDLFFSPGAIVGLINDLTAALMIFVFARVEFDTPSIAAMLTILGYSVNNTIVVYDRIRETVPSNPKKPLTVDELKPYVNKAVNDTLSRTINTTLTTLFASVAIWIFATGAIQSFAIVLTVGVAMGAFSSTFLAPACYLFAKRVFKQTKNEDSDMEHVHGPSREDRAKGVV